MRRCVKKHLASCCCCCCCWMEEKKCEREQKIVRVITVFLNDSFFSFSTVVREPLPRSDSFNSMNFPVSITSFLSHSLSALFLTLTFSFKMVALLFVTKVRCSHLICVHVTPVTQRAYTQRRFILSSKWFKCTRLKNCEYKSIESGKSFNVVAARISSNGRNVGN